MTGRSKMPVPSAEDGKPETICRRYRRYVDHQILARHSTVAALAQWKCYVGCVAGIQGALFRDEGGADVVWRGILCGDGAGCGESGRRSVAIGACVQFRGGVRAEGRPLAGEDGEWA